MTKQTIDTLLNYSLMTPRQILQSGRLAKLTRNPETTGNVSKAKPPLKSSKVQ